MGEVTILYYSEYDSTDSVKLAAGHVCLFVCVCDVTCGRVCIWVYACGMAHAVMFVLHGSCSCHQISVSEVSQNPFYLSFLKVCCAFQSALTVLCRPERSPNQLPSLHTRVHGQLSLIHMVNDWPVSVLRNAGPQNLSGRFYQALT